VFETYKRAHHITAIAALQIGTWVCNVIDTVLRARTQEHDKIIDNFFDTRFCVIDTFILARKEEHDKSLTHGFVPLCFDTFLLALSPHFVMPILAPHASARAQEPDACSHAPCPLQHPR